MILLIPEGFQLTHLILLDPDWQANLRYEDHVAIGTGETHQAAIDNAVAKAHLGQFAGSLFHLQRFFTEAAETMQHSLSLTSLGLRKPMKKRKI